jgi:hypothetical protein
MQAEFPFVQYTNISSFKYSISAEQANEQVPTQLPTYRRDRTVKNCRPAILTKMTELKQPQFRQS